MFSVKKSLLLSLVLILLLPFCAFSQQNGSKTAPKSQTPAQTKPAAKSNKPTQAKPAAKTQKAAAGSDQKRATQQAPPELQKIFDEVLKNKQQKEESTLIYEIDGLLIDETLTKTGHDFYDIFYSNWEAPEQVTNYTVRIIERPLRGRGFQILISVNDVEIIEQNLQPQYDMLEAAATEAVYTTRNYLLDYENLKNQIESDDQQGTGLF